MPYKPTVIHCPKLIVVFFPTFPTSLSNPIPLASVWYERAGWRSPGQLGGRSLLGGLMGKASLPFKRPRREEAACSSFGPCPVCLRFLEWQQPSPRGEWIPAQKRKVQMDGRVGWWEAPFLSGCVCTHSCPISGLVGKWDNRIPLFFWHFSTDLCFLQTKFAKLKHRKLKDHPQILAERVYSRK